MVATRFLRDSEFSVEGLGLRESGCVFRVVSGFRVSGRATVITVIRVLDGSCRFRTWAGVTAK